MSSLEMVDRPMLRICVRGATLSNFEQHWSESRKRVNHGCPSEASGFAFSLNQTQNPAHPTEGYLRQQRAGRDKGRSPMKSPISFPT